MLYLILNVCDIMLNLKQGQPRQGILKEARDWGVCNTWVENRVVDISRSVAWDQGSKCSCLRLLLSTSAAQVGSLCDEYKKKKKKCLLYVVPVYIFILYAISTCFFSSAG
jgi:hypothetical protein